MRTEAPALIADGLSHAFGKNAQTIALRDVSLQLNGGELSLFMGPSGSGKSTLLSVLSGLLQPNQGRVIALGRNIWAMSDYEREEFRRQQCGFIFQGYNLFPSLTAWEQLEMVLNWSTDLSQAEVHQQIEQILSVLGVLDQAHCCPTEMSGGEKQRVTIARALIKEPMLCFADEPTSALDWTNGQAVVEMLKEICCERQSVLLIVSHDSRIIPYADRLFYLEDGALREAKPEHPQVERP